MMIPSACVPDIAVEPVGLPFSPQWLLVALAAGFLGLRARRAIAAKRATARPAEDGDRGQAA